MTYVKMFLLTFFSINFSLNAAKLIEGNVDIETGQTFGTAVSTHVIDKKGTNFYVGASAAGLNEYSVSLLNRYSDKFVPLAQENVSLNSQNAPNPLYNAAVQFMSLLEETDSLGVQKMIKQYPVIVLQSDLTTIYIIDQVTNLSNISMFSRTNIKDPNNLDINSILNLTASNNCVFATIQGNTNTGFTGTDNGIATLFFGNVKVGTGQDAKTIRALIQTGTTAQIGTASDSIRIANDLTAMTVRDMHWDSVLSRLYIAFDVTTGAVAGDGGRSLVVGRFINGQLTLEEIMNPATLNNGDTDTIIGAQSAGANVSIEANKVRTMQTSNRLHYLIVQGDIGGSNRNVYSLPLVSNSKDLVNHGKLAKFDSIYEDTLQGRFFKTPAANNNDLVKSNNPRAIVGRGLAPADVIDMQVLGDMVVVLVNANDNVNQRRRIYYSRALFDSNARIKDWTIWKPLFSGDRNIFGFGLDFDSSNHVIMEGATNNAIQTIKRTQWTSGTDDSLGNLNSLLQEQLPENNGGIQTFIDIPENNLLTSDATFAIAAGNKKVALIETGRGATPNLAPNKGNFSDNVVEFTNGAIETTFAAAGPTRVISISGGILDDIGPIESGVFARTTAGGTRGRIFVGGVDGLAALPAIGQAGIVDAGIRAGFEGLTNGMTFSKVGDYRFVKKLINSGNFLYVLTDLVFDRIDLTNVNLPATRLATSTDLGGSFIDCVVSSKLAIIATSNGVFRIGNGQNVDTVTDFSDASWTELAVPQKAGHVIKLFPISSTGLEQDFAINEGGQLYILNGFRGNNKAQLNRFSVENVAGAEVVSNTTIQAFPDQFALGILSYFINYGSYRHRILDDGAFKLTSNHQNLNTNSFVRLEDSNLLMGTRFAFNRSKEIVFSGIAASEIYSLIRSSGSGDTIVIRDNGLQINE